MSTVAVTAGKAAVKKVVKKKAVEAAKSTAKHKMESVTPRRDVKEAKAARVAKTKTVISDAGTKVRSQHRSFMKRATATYSVRRYHNLLLAMWLTGTVILITSFFQNDALTPADKWKKLFAFQFAMFGLSLLVLIQSLSKMVAYLSVVIVLTIAFTNRKDIINTFNSFSNGLTAPPLKDAITNAPIGTVNGIPKVHPINSPNPDVQTIIPRTIST